MDEFYASLNGFSSENTPFKGMEGASDPSNQFAYEMNLNQAWKDRFKDEIDDHPAREGAGYVRQAGTCGIIPGFQG